MQKTILIQNPNCSKSRSAKDLLCEAGIEFDIIDYIKEGIDEKILKKLPTLLNLAYIDFIRKSEDIFRELKLDGKIISDKKWLALLKKHPVLLERPILIHNGKAIVARPPEKVLQFVQKLMP